MKMVRMSKDPASFDQMAAINSLWPGIQVIQINRKPSVKLDKYIDDFDSIAWDCQVAEIDLSDSDGDVLKFVYDIINHSDFVKRGGVLVQLVATPIPATETTPATVVYNYNQILQAIVNTRLLTPPDPPPKLDLNNEDESNEDGEVIPIEESDSTLLEELKELPDNEKDK